MNFTTRVGKGDGAVVSDRRGSVVSGNAGLVEGCSVGIVLRKY